MFEILFLIIVAAYFILATTVAIGTKKKFVKTSNDKLLPSSTIIVAARNEETNIENCLRSLNELEYPVGKLEIIIVNDDSDDNTGQIIKEFIKGYWAE